MKDSDVADEILLAKFLGYEICKGVVPVYFIRPENKGQCGCAEMLPYMRTIRESDEWCGRLLEKIGEKYKGSLHFIYGPYEETLWFVKCSYLTPSPVNTWKDAVVDAALVVARSVSEINENEVSVCEECKQNMKLLEASIEREAKLKQEQAEWKKTAEYWKSQYDRVVTKLRQLMRTEGE